MTGRGQKKHKKNVSPDTASCSQAPSSSLHGRGRGPGRGRGLLVLHLPPQHRLLPLPLVAYVERHRLLLAQCTEHDLFFRRPPPQKKTNCGKTRRLRPAPPTRTFNNVAPHSRSANGALIRIADSPAHDGVGTPPRRKEAGHTCSRHCDHHRPGQLLYSLGRSFGLWSSSGAG